MKKIKIAGFLPVFLGILLVFSCRKETSTEKYIAGIPAKQLENYTFDRTSPLWERVSASDAMVLENIRGMDQRPDYEFYPLSEKEKSLLKESFQLLPPSFQEVLQERLIGIYFIQDFFSSGLTDFVLSEEGEVYTILFLNPRVFDNTISQLLTYRDNSCFDMADGDLELEIRITGDYSGLLYILMHESAHIIDYTGKKTPYVHSIMRDLHYNKEGESAFTDQFWKDYDKPEDFLYMTYNNRLKFYSDEGSDKIPNGEMIDVYRELEQSPFASLYSCLNWAEDYAEYTTLYYFTQYLHMEYRIRILQKNESIWEYKPLANNMVLQRESFLDIF
jgi:hypothetical protein